MNNDYLVLRMTDQGDLQIFMIEPRDSKTYKIAGELGEGTGQCGHRTV